MARGVGGKTRSFEGICLFIYLAAVGLSCGTQDLGFGIWQGGFLDGRRQ